uniref:Uncharacterized protein n=1 Tax=Sander lucioperca TaxID=283035 RepID=A0A8D0DBC8_SANLU
YEIMQAPHILRGNLQFMQRKCGDLKYPPVGMENVADSSSSWPWFHLMNEAMEGRLASSAPLLTPVTHDDDQHPDPAPRHRPRAVAAPPPTSSSDYAQEVFGDSGRDAAAAAAAGGGGGEPNQQSSVDSCDGALGGLEREWEMVERERAALEREREMVDRDRAAMERERAAVQAERLWLERERAAVERDRAMVEQERAALDQRERAAMVTALPHYRGHVTPAAALSSSPAEFPSVYIQSFQKNVEFFCDCCEITGTF